MGRLRNRLLAVTIVSACSFTASLTGSQDAAVPDAGPCQALGSSCAGDEIRDCQVIGEQPKQTKCAWGCTGDAAPRCMVPVPGGVLGQGDLADDARLMDATLSNDDEIDTDDGDITNVRDKANGDYASGIHFFVRNNVGIYVFRNLTISGPVHAHGPFALTLVALGTITVDGVIDMRDGCAGTTPPGGFAGGAGGAAGGGATSGGAGGAGGSDDCSGGGGGGNGALGGSGGASNGTTTTNGGLTNAMAVTLLVGGGGGAGGGGSQSDRGSGGGGGGAIHLFAMGGIVFGPNGGIDAAGCGGLRGTNSSCGGGGGAGGTILVEGVTIGVGNGAKLVVNGGGGGAAAGSGSDGQLSLARANGGNGGTGNDGKGGSGGADVGLAGLPGVSSSKTGGGGGGGVGFMRFGTRSGMATINPGAVLSPAPTTAGATTTFGVVLAN